MEFRIFIKKAIRKIVHIVIGIKGNKPKDLNLIAITANDTIIIKIIRSISIV